MKSRILLSILVALSLTLLVSTSLSNESFKFKSSRVLPPGVEYVSGEVLVKYRDGITQKNIASLTSRLGTRVLSVHRGGFQRLAVPVGLGEQAFIAQLEREVDVEYAELNTICYATMVPNDPLYDPYQWHFPSVNAEQAWDIARGAGVIVGILDSGIAYEDYPVPGHETGTVQAGVTTYLQAPDLEGASFAAGYDFINDDSHPNDNNGHGTHVAGTVAQTTNNSYGVAGLAFECTLMPVKVLNYQGSGSAASLIDGLHYAADNGADVVNMSLSWPPGYDPGSAVHSAVQYAYNAGVVLVGSSGNAGVSTVSYPAAYPEVIAVGATRYDDQLTGYSQYGTAQELVAPGGDIFIDQNGDGYGDGVLQNTFTSYDPGPPEVLADPTDFGWWFYEGTSMAAPHVVGLIAMMISNGQTGVENIRTILHETAVDLGAAGWDQSYGYGLIDAYAALTYGPPPPVAEFSGDPTSGVIPLDVQFTDLSTGDITSWNWTFGDGGTSTLQHPSHRYEAEGYYTVSLTVSGPNGSDTETKVDYIHATSGGEVDDYANQDIPVAGTVAGTFNDTHASDNVYEAITERQSGGKPSNRHSYLEHKWTINVTGGTSVTFYVEAHQSASTDGDNFVFAYSTNDATYTDLVTVNSTSDMVYSATMPSSLSGTVYIRVTDTDQTSGHRELNTVYVDEMYIKSLTGPPPPPVAEFAGDPTSGCTPLTVQFTDLSTGGPTTWDWDFGDGGTSTVQNPSYEYQNAGYYTVTLTVTNATGSDSETKTDYIFAEDCVEVPMFVEYINMSLETKAIFTTAVAELRVVEDTGGYPGLGGVNVSGHWYGLTSDTDNFTTAADGTGSCKSDEVKKASGQFCFQVDALTKSGYYWDTAKGVTSNCIATASSNLFAKLDEFSIKAYPNPCNPSANIAFVIPERGFVNLSVFSVTGELVCTLANEELGSGLHIFNWDGRNSNGRPVGSGIYFFRFDSEKYDHVGKIVMVK
jgi:serine protease